MVAWTGIVWSGGDVEYWTGIVWSGVELVPNGHERREPNGHEFMDAEWTLVQGGTEWT